MKYPYINTSQNFLHYKWQKWNSNKFKNGNKRKKKSKAYQTWLGRGSKAVIRVHFSTQKYTYNYLAVLSQNFQRCGSKMVLEERWRENMLPPPYSLSLMFWEFQWNGTSLLLKKTACLPVLSEKYRVRKGIFHMADKKKEGKIFSMKNMQNWGFSHWRRRKL